MDFAKFSGSKCLTQNYRQLVQTIVGEESNLWPNTLHRMYFINTGWIFRVAWRIVSNFAHPITVAKVKIVGGDYLKHMTKDIPLNQIPKRYGGTCELPIKYGYCADIENDLLDGDYGEGDPIDLNTVKCVRNIRNGTYIDPNAPQPAVDGGDNNSNSNNNANNNNQESKEEQKDEDEEEEEETANDNNENENEEEAQPSGTGNGDNVTSAAPAAVSAAEQESGGSGNSNDENGSRSATDSYVHVNAVTDP